MAWTNPTTWVAGDVVTAAELNAQVRDNLKHVAGTAGFSALSSTLSAAHGIEPLSGFFAGAAAVNCHVEGGVFHATTATTGWDNSFRDAFATAPAVIITESATSGTPLRGAYIIGIGTTGFIAWGNSVVVDGWYMAWGSDT